MTSAPFTVLSGPTPTARRWAADPGNCYPFGQCTWYVKERYPLIPCDMGNGGDWLTVGDGADANGRGGSGGARGHGYAISSVPRPLWVVVFMRHGTGASRYGHVAVVDSVSADLAEFNVREMNYYALGVEDLRTVKTDDQWIAGYFLPPGAPQSAQATPGGLAVLTSAVGTPMSAPQSNAAASGSGSIFDPVFRVITNSLLVVGGLVLMGAGVVLAVMGTSAGGAVLQAQTRAVGRSYAAYVTRERAQRAENRRKLRAAVRGRRTYVSPTGQTRETARPARVQRAYRERPRDATPLRPASATYPDGRPVTDEVPF